MDKLHVLKLEDNLELWQEGEDGITFLVDCIVNAIDVTVACGRSLAPQPQYSVMPRCEDCLAIVGLLDEQRILKDYVFVGGE